MLMSDIQHCEAANNQSLTDQSEQLCSNKRSLCEVCKEQPFKYHCPRCLISSCCLKCVQEHKRLSGCSGLRDRTCFVPTENFTDLHLLSDYRFLEDVERQTTLVAKDPVLCRGKKNNPAFLNILLVETRRRGISMRLAPYPLSQRTNNKTYYHRKWKQIEWHVQWVLPDPVHPSMTSLYGQVMENVILKEALEKLVLPSHLERLIHGDKPAGFYLKVPKSKKFPSGFVELDLAKSLGDNLTGQVIYENPTIHMSTENLCPKDSPQSPPVSSLQQDADSELPSLS